MLVYLVGGGLVFLTLQVMLNLICDDTKMFMMCIPKTMQIFAIPCVGATFVAQIGIIIHWCVKRRHKITKWAREKWSLISNQVVEVTPENENQEVVIAVINLQVKPRVPLSYP